MFKSALLLCMNVTHIKDHCDLSHRVPQHFVFTLACKKVTHSVDCSVHLPQGRCSCLLEYALTVHALCSACCAEWHALC